MSLPIKKIVIASALLVLVGFSALATWVGVRFLQHRKSTLVRLERLESFDRFSGRNLVKESLRHQLTAPSANFLEPKTKPLLSVEGGWTQIAGARQNGSWNANNYLKTKALENHEGILCTGFLGQEPGDADVWCLDGEKWSQVGGDGLHGSWSDKRYVTFLYSHRDALFAGVDSEIWRFANDRWQKIGSVGMPGKSCTAYSASALFDVVYFGVTDCGLLLYQFGPNGFSQTPLRLSARTLTGYSGVYELHNWQNKLIIGAIADFGTAGIFEFTPEEGALKIGGGGKNGSWINPGFTYPESIATHRGNLIVSFNRMPMVHEPISAVWSFDGSIWAPLGVDRMPYLWRQMNNYNAVKSVGGRLLVAGGGLPHGMASIWHMDSNGRFHQLGGHGIAGSWGTNDGVISSSSTAEYIYRIEEWDGKVVVGFGDAPGLAQLWAYDPNVRSK